MQCMAGIAENIAKIKSEIGSARLVAITKGRGVGDVNEAIAAGITEIGENRVQEASTKLPHLPANITKHMVGHLQRNKVIKAVELFDVIQSVGSVALAKKIAEEAEFQEKRIAIYVQVNISGKESQTGFSIGEIETAAEEIRKLQGKFFVVDGLMCIASIENPKGDFVAARAIAEKLRLQVRSYGMSGDYKVAFEEGSNMVRIGTAIFGKR